MPIQRIKQRLYVFIRDKSRTSKVTLVNLRLWAKKNHITQQDMGYALQELKKKGAVYYNKKYGWLTR